MGTARFLCVLLCVLCRREISGKSCDIGKELETEGIPGDIKLVGKCNEDLLAEHIFPAKLHCLDLCNQIHECKSINFNSKDSECMLFSITITEMLKKRCLITVDHDDSTIASEVHLTAHQIDVKKIDFAKVFIRMQRFLTIKLPKW